MFKTQLTKSQKELLTKEGLNQKQTEMFEEMLQQSVKNNKPWLLWISVSIIGLLVGLFLGKVL